jgi:hypothetical protein
VSSGLKAFFRLAKVWRLTDDEQARMLGDISRSTLYAWRASAPRKLPVETFRAVSLMLGIHALLGRLFPGAPEGTMAARVRRAGTLWFAPTASLVEFVEEGGPIAMDQVRRHLVHEAGGEVVPQEAASPFRLA